MPKPSPTMVERFLSSAEELLKSKPRSAAYRRRAVSSAYYAVFHALAAVCTSALLQSAGSKESRLRVYRALDHGPLKNAFSQAPLKDHPRFKEIGALVRQLQDERHSADYMPPDSDLFPINEAREIVDKARFVVVNLRELDQESRLVLATCLLFKERRQ